MAKKTIITAVVKTITTGMKVEIPRTTMAMEELQVG